MTPQQELIVAQALSILYAELKTGGEALQSPQAVRDFLRLHLVREEREVFAVLFLNAAGRVIEYVPMFYGTLNETRVYPREIARAALRLNAASVILAHNHPSGDIEPSMADRTLTAAVKQALDLLDVRVLDHFVIGAKGATSMAERGMM